MARKLVVIDRQTPMLLPPSLQEWLPEDDVVHLIIEAVEAVSESACHYNWQGTGSSQYPPRMMLALLIYCYARGIFSSRQIERATWRDIAVRFITADTHPDHDTIATFRRENRVLFEDCFVQVLALARRMKVGHLGDLALDGSVIEANAARRCTRSHEAIEEELAGLAGRVAELTRRAEAIDGKEAAEAAARDRLTGELAKAGARQKRLREALSELTDLTRERAQAREEERAKFDPRGPGQPPAPLESTPGPQSTINLSDPQARLLRQKKGGSAPAYNVQLAVAADPTAPLIVARRVCDEANDRRQLEPMAELAVAACPETGRIIVDCGYDNAAQIHAVEQRHGVIVYGPPEERKEPGSCPRRSRARQRTGEFREGMRACQRSSFGQKSQRLRATTVEPVFAAIKSVIGFRRFHLRGLAGANLEWDLICLSYNLQLISRRRKSTRSASQSASSRKRTQTRRLLIARPRLPTKTFLCQTHLGIASLPLFSREETQVRQAVEADAPRLNRLRKAHDGV